MSRFSPVDLSAYPVADILEALDFESYLARDRADLTTRWEARRLANASLPPLSAIMLESDPSSCILQASAYRETLLRARVNDALRSLTLAGAQGRALDHIGVTYYRTPRLVTTPATATTPATMEGDELYRQRLALAPESWSIAGPVGAYLFHAVSASADVLDVAVYSEDEGVALAPRVRVVVLSRSGDGTAPAALLATVQAALRRSDLRPIGDLVTVESAVPAAFDLTVNLRIRSGASEQMAIAAAEARLRRYCAGATRWMGDGLEGPVWLIGRTFRVESLAGVAMGGDPNILEADVVGADINPPAAGYNAAALAGVGTPAFQPLAAAVTVHLFTAPRLVNLTLAASVETMGWAT